VVKGARGNVANEELLTYVQKDSTATSRLL
jgi:hypothetical protein